ncbi:MAG: hypothetical protein HUK15_04355 [Bacteroidales bacterium]|nr:hypothetical protein [Bacteroidales bacterium]
MGFLKDLLLVGAGYAASEVAGSHTLRNAIDNKYDKDLEDVVDEWATRHGVVGPDNEMAYKLHKMAKHFEEWGYDDWVEMYKEF